MNSFQKPYFIDQITWGEIMKLNLDIWGIYFNRECLLSHLFYVGQHFLIDFVLLFSTHECAHRLKNK